MPVLIKPNRTSAVNGMLTIKPINQLGKYDPNSKKEGALVPHAEHSKDKIIIEPNFNLFIKLIVFRIWAYWHTFFVVLNIQLINHCNY